MAGVQSMIQVVPEGGAWAVQVNTKTVITFFEKPRAEAYMAGYQQGSRDEYREWASKPDLAGVR